METNRTVNYDLLLRELAENRLRVESKLMEYFEYRLHRVLLRYVPIVIYAIGLVGNSLSLAILVRRRMRRVSTYTYLAVLSVADTLVLTSGLLALWVGELTGRDISARNRWTCKLLSAVGYTVSDFSVWLIVAVTVERFIAVRHPLRAAAMCTHRTAGRVVAGVFVLAVGFNLNFVWTTELRPAGVDAAFNVVYECSAGGGYERFVSRVWPWIDAALYSALPFVVILLLNALIVDRVVRARRERRRSLLAAAPSYSGTRLPPPGGGRRRSTASSNSFSSSSAETKMALSVLLVTITFAFLVMTLPMNVVMIATAFWNDRDGGGGGGEETGGLRASQDDAFRRRSRQLLAKTVSELLMYVNHATNFFLYCGMGQKFRRELCSLVFCDGGGGGGRRGRRGGGEGRDWKRKTYPAGSISFNLNTRQSVDASQ